MTIETNSKSNGVNSVNSDQHSQSSVLPTSLQVERHGDIAVLRINRAKKRNALNDATVLGLEAFFTNPPQGVRAVVLDADGDHFSAGLDLSELTERDAFGALEHSRMWHRVFDRIEHGTLPVISVLKGAVVGGGGSVRIPRLIGAHRMTDMMLTGRVLSAEEGHTLGLSHYLTGPGEGLTKALELAGKVAGNSPVTNFAVLQALPRITQASPDEGYLLESLMAAVAGSSTEAQTRMRAFLDGRAGKVQRT